jgi:hypothetical protein
MTKPETEGKTFRSRNSREALIEFLDSLCRLKVDDELVFIFRTNLDKVSRTRF